MLLTKLSLFSSAVISLLAFPAVSFASSLSNITIESEYSLINANILEEALQNNNDYGRVQITTNRSLKQNIRFYEGSYLETASQSDLDNIKTGYINLLTSTDTAILRGTINQKPLEIRTLTYEEIYGIDAINATINNLMQPDSNPVINPDLVFAPLTVTSGIDRNQWWNQVLNQYFDFDMIVNESQRDTLKAKYISEYNYLLDQAFSPLELGNLGIDYVSQDSSLVRIGIVNSSASDDLSSSAIGGHISRSLKTFFLENGGLSLNEIDNLPNTINLFPVKWGGNFQYNQDQSFFLDSQVGVFETANQEITFQDPSVPEASPLFGLKLIGGMLLITLCYKRQN